MQTITPLPRAAQFPHLGAFESTKLMGSGTDILGTTRHIERWEADLQLLRSASLTQLRYSVPWHRIEREPGAYDFTWLDGPMLHMHTAGMTPVLDPLHHISFPDWLTNGFANPAFPHLYERFATEVARRYPWANLYTICNEPCPQLSFAATRAGGTPTRPQMIASSEWL
jgi:beta-glucosidase/6-phospho-beta-glucosidase/beta-galactosidase